MKNAIRMRQSKLYMICITLCFLLISYGESKKKKASKSEHCEKGEKGCKEGKRDSKYSKDHQFQCEYCSKGFATEESLRRHKQDKHGIIPSKTSVDSKGKYKCEFCSDAFDSYEALLQHTRDKHKIKENDALPSTKKLKKDAFICDTCLKTFRSHDQLLRHQKDAHGQLKRARDLQKKDLDGNNEFICPICVKKFKSEHSLNQHQLATNHYEKAGSPKTTKASSTATSSFHCPICMKKFKSERSLGQHQRATGHYENDVDGSSKSVETSTSSVSFHCPVCMKKFKSERSLDQHQRATGHYENDLDGSSKSVEKSSSSLPFYCPVCMRRFKSEEELLQHQDDTNHNNRDSSKQRRKQALYTLQREVSFDLDDKKESVQVVKKIVDDIMREVRKLEGGNIYSPSVRKAGSYAAKTKIRISDEFDMNIPLNIDVEEIRTNGRLGYSYEDKKHDRRSGPSAKNMNVDRHIVDDPDFMIPERQAAVRPRIGAFPERLLFKGDLIPHKVLQDLYRKVQKAIRNLELDRHVFLNRESHGPALTLLIKQVDDHDISVDLVPSIPCDYHVPVSIGGWPRTETKQALTEEQIERALDAGMHLVPKGDETWAISYSKVERALFEILDKGHQCRRRVMQTIKRYTQKCKSRSRDGHSGISSHIIKNQILWSVEQRSEDDYWNEKHFDICLVETVEDLEVSLQEGLLPNYFDISENILANKDGRVLSRLAICLQEEIEDFL